MQKKSVCPYCYGHGLYKGYVDIGARRTMERGPHNTPMHKDQAVYQCDVCKKPASAPPCPVKFVRIK